MERNVITRKSALTEKECLILVMSDKELTAESKAIYAYILTWSKNGVAKSLSVDGMTQELNMTKKRLFKHRKLLVEKGYLIVKRVATSGGANFNNYGIAGCCKKTEGWGF